MSSLSSRVIAAETALSSEASTTGTASTDACASSSSSSGTVTSAVGELGWSITTSFCLWFFSGHSACYMSVFVHLIMLVLFCVCPLASFCLQKLSLGPLCLLYVCVCSFNHVGVVLCLSVTESGLLCLRRLTISEDSHQVWCPFALEEFP